MTTVHHGAKMLEGKAACAIAGLVRDGIGKLSITKGTVLVSRADHHGGRDVLSYVWGRRQKTVQPSGSGTARVSPGVRGLLLLLPQAHIQPSAARGARAWIQRRLAQLARFVL